MPALSVSADKLNEAMAVAVKYGMPHIGLEAGESTTLTQADLSENMICRLTFYSNKNVLLKKIVRINYRL